VKDNVLILARYFFWLRLQVHYELEVAEKELSERINREVKVLHQPTVHA